MTDPSSPSLRTSNEGTLQGEDLRIALLTALASAYESGSLQRILREVLEGSPKAPGRSRDEAIRAAGIAVDDLLADFDSPRDPNSDAAEVSFDLSTSPSNEESGGFFISTGGGGLNLPLDDDDDAFKERCPGADDEDLTEETRRVYLSKGEDGQHAEAAAVSAHVGTLEDSLEMSQLSELSASLEPPLAPPEGDSHAASGALTETIRSELKVCQQDLHEEMLIRLHDQLLAKHSVMQCVLKGLLNVQAREMKSLKASLAEEPKTARVEEVAPEGVDDSQAIEPGRRYGRGSKSGAGSKKRRTVTSNLRSTTSSSVSAGAKASTRSSMPARTEGASKRRASKVNVERQSQPASPEGAETSSRPSSHSSRRSDREEEPEREATDPEAALGPTEGQEGQEAETGQEDTLVDDQGIGVCEVSEAEFQLLFDAGVLYQAYGFYPQQPVGFSFIPSFGEQQIPAEAVTADPEEWYQPNPATPVTQAPQGISPQMLGAVDPMYYQQYQYQNVPQIPQVQPQQGFSPQYQYPYYQQGQYAQYAAGAQPCGAQQLYQHQQAANRPPSQQAQAPASGAAGRSRQNASKDTDSAPGSAEASDAEAEGDKEAESPKDGAKNAKKPKGKAAAKTKVRKKPVEKPPVDKGPKCQLFFLPLDTLQHWKKDPDGQKDEHSHHEEHGEMSDEISHGSHSDEDWPAMGHHWSEAHVPSEYEDHTADAHEEEPMESPPGDIIAGSALNSARALKSARTMPDRTADQPQSNPIRPPQSKPKMRRPQPNVVFAGDGGH